MTRPPAGPPPLLNIANVLTGVRLVLVPVFLVALFVDHGHAAWTGGSPRSACSPSPRSPTGSTASWPAGAAWSPTFGKVADPIADKALIGLGAGRAVGARAGCRGGPPS